MLLVRDSFDPASLYPRATRPPIQGPLVDIDHHFNEETDTWEAVELEEARRLHLRSDEHGRRFLYLGDRLLGPGRATRPDEYARIARLVACDEGGFERERVRLEGNPPSFVDVVDPTASDIGLRVAAMDRMATDFAIQFPSYGFYWPEVVEGLDSAVVHPHMQAWNTWIAARCRLASTRVAGVGQVGWYDVEQAAAEIYRCAELGLCGVTVAAKPFRGLPWSDASNEPIWRALSETGLPLFLHIVLMRFSLDPAWDLAEHAAHSGPDIISMVNRNVPAEAALTDLVFGGVLDRYPRIKVATVECGGLWVESFLKRIDWAYTFLCPRNRYLRERLPLLPSDYLLRQLKVASFPFEPTTRFMLDVAPHMFMYASDFPHDEGTARGIELFETMFDAEGASAGFRQGFYGDNARELLSRRAPGHAG